MLTVKVTHAGSVERLLARLGTSFTPATAEADLLVAVEPMVNAARSNVVLGPPSIHLVENIGAAPVPDVRGRVAVGAFKVPKLGEIFYGRFLEFGSVKQSATPWLRPADDSTRNTVMARVVSALRARVTAAVRR